VPIIEFMAADPAPLVVATGTRHVGASTFLLDTYLAPGTAMSIVVAHPVTVELVDCFLAANAFVPLITASETHYSFARRANGFGSK